VKVLSVQNPWAYLIIYHGKDIENRTWKTKYRGRIAIHCSKKSDSEAWSMTEWAHSELQEAFDAVIKNRAEIEKLNGKIIGTVDLYNCTYPELTAAANSSLWAGVLSPWHFWLKDPIAIAEPIPARGMLGLWDYPGL
jgi:hypothetical protein